MMRPKTTYANVGSVNGKHSAGGHPVLCEADARWAVEAGGGTQSLSRTSVFARKKREFSRWAIYFTAAF